MKGAMNKKADGDICAHLLCFSTIFSEIRSTSIFFRGRLNGVVKSDLTLPLNLDFVNILILYFLTYRVRTVHILQFKRPQKKTLMLRISEKLVEKQRRCAQISPSAFLSSAPFVVFFKNLNFFVVFSECPNFNH